MFCNLQVYERSKSGAMLDLVDGSSLLYRLQLEGMGAFNIDAKLFKDRNRRELTP